MKCKYKIVKFLKQYHVLLLVGVLAISLFTRFYDLSNIFVFTIDEEYHVLLAQQILQGHLIKLIGVSVSAGFYLGALWTYLTAFLLLIGHNNPLLLGYFAASLGIVTTLLVYFLGKKIFGNQVALMASFLYASLPLVVFFDQKYWNDSPIPLLSLVLFSALVLTKKSARWWILVAVIFGLIFHTHLSILPYLFITLILFFQQRNQIPKKTVIYALLVFLVLISPLLLFDLTHNFTNLKAPIRFLQGGTNQQEGLNPLKHAEMLWQTLGRYYYLQPGSSNADEINWGCTSLSMNIIPAKIDLTSTRTNPPFAVSFLAGLLLIIFLFKKSTWLIFGRKLLLISLLVLMAAFLVFPGGALEYYLLGAFPLLCFIPALLITDLPTQAKKIGVVMLLLVGFFGVYAIISNNAEFGMGVRRELINQVASKIDNDSYQLAQVGGCQEYAGWRYLFSTYYKKPVASGTDWMFGWLYPQEISAQPADYTVTMVEDRYVPSRINNATKFTIGGFSAYVVKNN